MIANVMKVFYTSLSCCCYRFTLLIFLINSVYYEFYRSYYFVGIHILNRIVILNIFFLKWGTHPKSIIVEKVKYSFAI